MFKNKKIITIFLVVIFIGIFFIFINNYFIQKNNPKNFLSKLQTTKWSTYTDNRYHYSIDFPPHSNISTIYEKKVVNSKNLGGGAFLINGGVTFTDANLNDFGIMSVTIFENTKFKNPDEWLKSKNKRFDYPSKYFEKNILIDGIKAVVVHEIGGINKQTEEHFWNEKTAIFIKDGTLFEIHTRFGSGNKESNKHQKVWNSFKFIN